MTADIESELSTLCARDALVLAAVCVPPERTRAPGHKLRHALVLRLIAVRRSMKRLERQGYLKRGWHVDYLGARCGVPGIGNHVATAVGVIVNVASSGGPLDTVDTWSGCS